jgi:hypothetical protein
MMVTTAMVVHVDEVWQKVQRMSEKFQYHHIYLLTILCLYFDACAFQVCFQAPLKANVTSHLSISNNSNAKWPKDFQLRPLSVLQIC